MSVVDVAAEGWHLAYDYLHGWPSRSCYARGLPKNALDLVMEMWGLRACVDEV